MTNIICDACKRPIPAATRTYAWEIRYDRYETHKDKDICPDCLEKLYNEVHAEMEESPAFHFKEAKNIFEDKLEELCAWDDAERNKVLELD